jgi:NAD-dependent SIR2 family protein deacetylase
VLNEIHGSWFDPSNPVVKYSGSLRADLFERMEVSAETADLTIVLGTSLSGLCSDMVAEKTAERSLNSKSLGIVIINLQQTLMDGSTTLRIFSQTDRLMKILTECWISSIKLLTTPTR